MEQANELSLQINKLKSCVETLTGIAEALEKMLSGQEGKGAQGNAGTQAQPREKRATIRLDDDEPMSFDEMRHRITLLLQAGLSSDALLELAAKYGAKKLSEIDPSHYEDLLADAQAMTDGH